MELVRGNVRLVKVLRVIVWNVLMKLEKITLVVFARRDFLKLRGRILVKFVIINVKNVLILRKIALNVQMKIEILITIALVRLVSWRILKKKTLFA